MGYEERARDPHDLRLTNGEDPLPICRVAELAEPEPGKRWLVDALWGRAAVGFVAGHPKLGKTWLGLDLALSVASNTPCLERFEVQDPGEVLVYLAEDHPALPRQRGRILRAGRRGRSPNRSSSAAITSRYCSETGTEPSTPRPRPARGDGRIPASAFGSAESDYIDDQRELRHACSSGNGRDPRRFRSMRCQVWTRTVQGWSATLTWDGSNDEGSMAPAGLYLVRLTANRAHATAQIVRIVH